MKNVNKSVLIWYSPEEMFALVTDVAHYSDFLPWCDQAKVLEQDETSMTAEVGMAFGGLRKSFVTRNTHSDMPGGGKQVASDWSKARFRGWKATGAFTPWATASSAPAR